MSLNGGRMFKIGTALVSTTDEFQIDNLSEIIQVNLDSYDGLKKVSSDEFELSKNQENWSHEIEVDMTGIINFAIYIKPVSSASGKVTVQDA